MSVVLTVPAVEAVLAFQRQPCDCHDRHMDPELRRASRGGYDHDDHGPLAEWVTVNAEPTEECEVRQAGDAWYVLDDAGEWIEVDEPEPRPLAPGDRVTVVAGELPEHLSEHGDWLAWTKIGHRTLGDPFVVDMDERALNLPSPGTVVGTATVEWVGPIYGEPDEYEPQAERCVERTDQGLLLWHHTEGSARKVTSITSHDHCDWTPGRWAVRLTDTEAAKRATSSRRLSSSKASASSA